MGAPGSSDEGAERPHRLVLHVGTEKTATTHIQQTLAANRWTLRREGFVYPHGFGEASWGHHNLTWWVKGQGRRFRKPTPLSLLPPSWLWRRMGRGASSLVLSSETMTHLRRDEWQRLLADVRVAPEIVLFLRRRDELASSLWRERVKQRAVPGIGAYVDGLVTRRRSPVKYLRLVRLLADVVGRRRLHLVVYDRVVDAGRDPADVVTRDVLGLTAPLPRRIDGRANPSLGFGEAEVLRRLQHLDETSGRPLGARTVTRRFLASEPADAIAGLREGSRTTLDLDGRFADEDEVLLDRFGDRFVGLDSASTGPGELFGERATEPVEVPVFDPAAGDEETAALYRRLRRRAIR